MGNDPGADTENVRQIYIIIEMLYILFSYYESLMLRLAIPDVELQAKALSPATAP